jgi:hypothetical protein
MDDKAELITTLAELVRLLEDYGQAGWAHWMRAAKSQLEGFDAHGLDKIIAAHGGMGSFNDLVIGYRLVPDGGVQTVVWSDAGRAAAQRLEELRGKMFILAAKLNREIDL